MQNDNHEFSTLYEGMGIKLAPLNNLLVYFIFFIGIFTLVFPKFKTPLEFFRILLEKFSLYNQQILVRPTFL